MKRILRKILRWTLLTLLSLLLLLLFLLALIAALVGTEPGSRWVVNLAVKHLPMEVGTVRGDLLTGLDVSYIDYQLPGEDDAPGLGVRVEELSVRWRPVSLLYNTVSVQSLQAASVQVTLPPPGDEEPEPFEWPSLALPVMVELDRVKISDIRVLQQDTEFVLDSLSGSATLGLVYLRLRELLVVQGEDRLAVDGRVGLRYPYASELEVQWRYQLEGEENGDEPMTFAGMGEISGDLQQLIVHHQLAEPLALESELTLALHLDDAERSPELDSISRWRRQSPPAAWLPDDQPVPVTSGELQLSGWLDDYRVQLDGSVSANDWPELTLQLAGAGNLESFDLARLQASARDISLRAAGQVRWTPELSWQLEAEGEGLDPSLLLEDWPGNIAFSLAGSGSLTPEGEWQGELQRWELSGRLRDLPLESRGQAAYRDGRFETEGLAVTLGTNQLHLAGSVDQRLNLHWQVYAPLLNQIDPSLDGNLTAHGSLIGTLQQPRLEADVTGRRLRWQEEQVAFLKVAASTESTDTFTLALVARDMQVGGQELAHISLSGEGRIDDHRLRLALVSDDFGNLSGELAGGYLDEALWQGALNALNIRPQGLPAWQLLSSETFSVGPSGLELDNQCLTPRLWQGRQSDRVRVDAQGRETVEPPTQERAEGRDRWQGRQAEPGSLCVQGGWQPGQGGRFSGELDNIPLRLLREWLRPEVEIAGVLAGRFNLVLPDPDQSPGESLSADLQVATRDGEFRYRHGEDDVEIYVLREASLSATLAQQSLEARWVSDWQGYGDMDALLTLQLDSGQLGGEVRARFDDLAPLEALVPRLHNVRGDLTAQINLSGTLAQPQFPGRIHLSEGAANIPELGLELTDIDLVVDSLPGGRLEARGSLTSGPGSLTLSADAEGFIEGDWRVNGRLEGEDVQVIQTSELQALLSPSLSLTATPTRLQLEGSAHIPKALAEIKSLPATATRVSDDVIIVDDAQRNGNNGPVMTIHSNIRLRLGDDVRFNGFGVESRLSGELTLIKSPTRGLLTTGDVGVAEGVYKAYGQDLTIERGRLLFQGPYDNPGLDILAVRTTRTHRAGLEITGTLQRPRSRVFSVPAESESDALAILITGSPLSGAGATSADASMVINAVGTLGLERSQFITEEIAQTFGLDEFTIRTTDDLQESALWIGKYLTPRLFVRYAVGLFDQTSSIGMRYQINEGLHLEAESGIKQSVDMIYRIER